MNRDELLTQMVMEIGPDDWWDGELRRLYEGCIFGWNEYQLRRAEIINKPDWSEAPEWAEWLSQEEDGNWCWHQLKPEMDPTGWTMFAPKDEEHALALRGKRPNGHDWRQTLERRPTTTSLGATAFETDGGGDSYMFMTLEEQELPAEERHECDRCGGAWWSPMNNHCPCLDQFEGGDHDDLTFGPLPGKGRAGVLSKDALQDCPGCGATPLETHTRSCTHGVPDFLTPGRAGGLKFDADKPRIELLIQGTPRALEAVGQVLTFGAQKYEAHSWQHVEDNHNRYWAAKSRHELARAKGETHDPETGLLHLAHEACNALFLLELALMEQDSED